MTPTVETSGFVPLAPIVYVSKASESEVRIAPEDVIKVIVDTNKYLYSLTAFFADADFDFHEAIGQRNLSGVIGEVFVKFFEQTLVGYEFNPHADGRPDILDLTSSGAKEYYETECFTRSNGRVVPIKGRLAPFKYGGLEVKSSIGDPVSNYKSRIKKELDIGGFSVGIPRIDYLRSINFWGHHPDCANLLGLYYDYVKELDSSPQVFLAMHSELTDSSDWSEVSVGKSTSKKTSNCSLTKAGRSKLHGNVVAAATDAHYLARFKEIGLNVPEVSSSSE